MDPRIKIKSTEIDPQMTQLLELAIKLCKPGLITYYIYYRYVGGFRKMW